MTPEEAADAAAEAIYEADWELGPDRLESFAHRAGIDVQSLRRHILRTNRLIECEHCGLWHEVPPPDKTTKES